MKKLFTVFFIVVLHHQLWAWGKEGHHIVAEVAMSHMDSATRAKVTAILAGTTPEDAATWMDDMRSNHACDYMKPWHYIDFPKGTSYPATTEANAVTEMTAAYLELLHRQTLTTEQAKVAVMILFHLTGDLHMPLHAGYAEDKGGNAIQVTFHGKATNLHSVWDTDIIEQQAIKQSDIEALYMMLSPDDLKSLRNTDIVSWMSESRALLPQVYSFTGNKLEDSYGLDNKMTIEKQLLYAGIHLASLLESALANL